MPGDVYKYTDERGNTMYTDRPMPGAIKVSSRLAASSGNH